MQQRISSSLPKSDLLNMNFCLFEKEHNHFLFSRPNSSIVSGSILSITFVYYLHTVLIKIAEPANVWHWGYHIPEPSSVTAL